MVVNKQAEVEELYKYNHLVGRVENRNTIIIPEFELECGETLYSVPVAYSAFGELNEAKDNCIVVCHAFSGNSDVSEWWGPLLGSGKAFDTDKFFVICCNVLGAPYGTASPLTLDKRTGKNYGPTFPLTSVRDDVRLHKRVIVDELGVKEIALVIGGSMGGMQTLEWAFTYKDIVKTFVPMATSGRHSAWGISWGEMQRQAIYGDQNYNNGYYTMDKKPDHGLSTARIAGMLTYRSFESAHRKFGRKTQGRHLKRLNARETTSEGDKETTTKATNGTKTNPNPNPNDDRDAPTIYSAQGYLRYQGEKFVDRYDANCFLAISKKLDTHDLTYHHPKFNYLDGQEGTSDNTTFGAEDDEELDEEEMYKQVLASAQQPCMVVGIENDGIFSIKEQYELAKYIPNAKMELLSSTEGHDGFLLEVKQVSRMLKRFIRENLPKFNSDEDSDSSICSAESSMSYLMYSK
ncbi:Homoserine O-acetyltransferase [Zancudomyces culisetae]|uniref:Homoserine O-acetyltransferase n=1 Tax=Zancudomyces culisetae TaxID=1213189 RepID=A0A1R1PCH2_ZANCU|nr:Homoserine O-acetyltransferase [Zancudomyces culisetae]|eukprot:OMH78653.1 Homoserine O-acetyltransferase [Zancudomyces culisetae]